MSEVLSRSNKKLADIHFFYGVNFIVSGLLHIVILLLPFISRDLQLSLSQVGMIDAGRNIAGIALAIPSAYLFLSIGGITMSLLAIGGMAFLMGIMGMASTAWIFIGAYFLLGVVQKGFTPNAALIAKFSRDQQRRGAIMGMYYSMGDMGKIALSSGILFLVPSIGWRYGFGIGCAVSVLFILVALVLGIEKDTFQAEHAKKHSSHTPWKLLFRTRAYVLGLWMTLLDTFSSTPILLFLGFFLLSKGFSVESLGWYTGAFFTGLLLGRAGFGHIADRRHPAKVFIAMQFSLAIILLLLVWFSSPWSVFVTCFLLGAFTRGTIPVRQVMILESIEAVPGRPDRAVGFNTMVYNFTTAVSASLFGLVAERFGINMVYTLSAIVAVAATIPAMGLYFSDPKRTVIPPLSSVS